MSFNGHRNMNIGGLFNDTDIPGSVSRDLQSILFAYPTLTAGNKPGADGRTGIILSGKLPVTTGSSSSFVPVTMFLPHDYPNSNPVCGIDMAGRPGMRLSAECKYLDRDGTINSAYIVQNGENGIKSVVQAIIGQFARQAPLDDMGAVVDLPGERRRVIERFRQKVDAAIKGVNDANVELDQASKAQKVVLRVMETGQQEALRKAQRKQERMRIASNRKEEERRRKDVKIKAKARLESFEQVEMMIKGNFNNDNFGETCDQLKGWYEQIFDEVVYPGMDARRK